MKGDKKLIEEVNLLEKILSELEKGNPARILDFSEKEEKFLKNYNLLTQKPVLYIGNVSEEDIITDGKDNPYVKEVKEYIKKENSEIILISAKIEQELSELEENEKKQFLSEMGIHESGLEKLIKHSYKLLMICLEFLQVLIMQVKEFHMLKLKLDKIDILMQLF